MRDVETRSVGILHCEQSVSLYRRELRWFSEGVAAKQCSMEFPRGEMNALALFEKHENRNTKTRTQVDKYGCWK